jgi:uncharacterized membrane protein
MAASLTIVVVGWLLIVLAAPVGLVRGHAPLMTLAAYRTGALVCHQRPERSFHVAGAQMPVCARCVGVYASCAAGVILAWTRRRSLSSTATRFILMIGAMPIALTVGLEWIGAIETSNVARFFTGLPFGFAAGVVSIASLRTSGGRTPTDSRRFAGSDAL